MRAVPSISNTGWQNRNRLAYLFYMFLVAYLTMASISIIVHHKLIKTHTFTGEDPKEESEQEWWKVVGATDRYESFEEKKETLFFEKKHKNWATESAVLEKVLQRSISNLESCNNDNNNNNDNLNGGGANNAAKSNTLLSEFGIINALSSWIDRDEPEQCHLPPSTSCHVNGWSVIISSHSINTNAPSSQKLHATIETLTQFPATSEIILLSNRAKPLSNRTSASILERQNSDPNHPLRIVYPSDLHLKENDPFNRYHPKLAPKMEAVLYIDVHADPPLRQRLMSGFELWKRNSAVQVGEFGRALHSTSAKPDERDRWNRAMDVEMDVSIRQVRHSWQRVSPHDESGTELALRRRNNKTDRHPVFLPVCRSADGGDAVGLSDRRVDFGAQIVDVSGSFLHRDWLCFLWHPVFQQVRKFVRDHPVRPHDIAVAVLIAQLVEKAPRVYGASTDDSSKPIIAVPPSYPDPKKDETTPKKRNQKPNAAMKKNILNAIRQKKETAESRPVVSANKIASTKKKKIPQRRLSQSNNNNNNDTHVLQTEALNSIIGYFGSVSPGSVGYCVGTPYYNERKRECEGLTPLEKLPWMHEGGLDRDACS